MEYGNRNNYINKNYHSNNNNFDKQDKYSNTTKVKFIKDNLNVHFDENDTIVGDNNKNFVDVAEDVIKKIKSEMDKKMCNDLSTSKIRNILAMIAEIYKYVISDSGENSISSEINSKLQYFKIRCYYEIGRDREQAGKKISSVEMLFENSNILDLIKDINNKKRVINYYHYFESLIAWHKYYIGKEN